MLCNVKELARKHKAYNNLHRKYFEQNWNSAVFLHLHEPQTVLKNEFKKDIKDVLLITLHIYWKFIKKKIFSEICENKPNFNQTRKRINILDNVCETFKSSILETTENRSIKHPPIHDIYRESDIIITTSSEEYVQWNQQWRNEISTS